jgi:hypothetical protein
MSSAQEKLLQHVVLFEFKASAKPEDIKKIENAFSALSTTIKEIKKFEWGTNNSPENLNQGFTHCFIVSFASEKDRDIYLPHPEHKSLCRWPGLSLSLCHWPGLSLKRFWLLIIGSNSES